MRRGRLTLRDVRLHGVVTVAELLALVLILAVAVALGMFLFAHLGTVALLLGAALAIGSIGTLIMSVIGAIGESGAGEKFSAGEAPRVVEGMLRQLVAGLKAELPPDLFTVHGYEHQHARIDFLCPRDLGKSLVLELVPSDSPGRFADARIVSWNWAGGIRGFASLDEVESWLAKKIAAHRLHGDPKETLYEGGQYLA